MHISHPYKAQITPQNPNMPAKLQIRSSNGIDSLSFRGTEALLIPEHLQPLVEAAKKFVKESTALPGELLPGS